MLALFLGAGFSKWSANLPLAEELFDFDVEPWGPRDNRKLEIVQFLKRRWDSAHPNGLSEQFIAEALRFPDRDRDAVLWYIVHRLSAPFIWKEFHAQRWRRHVLMIDENRKFSLPAIIKVRSFVQPLYGPLLAGVITTNYDMIVEYALGTKGFNYGVPNQSLMGRGPYPVSEWRHPVILRGRVPLAKIHGSISWDETGCYTDGRRGITGGALIVAPTPEKQPPKLLRPVWNQAENILKSVSRLLVFGFAFNPYDEAVLNLLKLSESNVKSVLLIDVESRTRRAHEIWPNAAVTLCSPPPKGDAWLRKWLRLSDSTTYHRKTPG